MVICLTVDCKCKSDTRKGKDEMFMNLQGRKI